MADGGRWEYTYDAAGQLVDGVRYAPRWPDGIEQVLATYGYQYGPMGNPTQRSEDAGVSAYTYNNLNQLVTGNWSGTLSACGWTRAAGLAGISVAAGQQTHAATVFQNPDWTATDQTTSQSSTSSTRPQDAVQFVHDRNGNMLGEGQWLYTWDDENRLVSAESTLGALARLRLEAESTLGALARLRLEAESTLGALARLRLEYVYDGLGRRRVKREYAWATDHWQLATEHFFLWDSWLLLSERITDHTRTPALTHTRTYVSGLDLSGQLGGEGMDPMATAGGIGGILAVASASSAAQTANVALFLYDGNGNVIDLVDAGTAAVLATYEYGPFGNTLVASGPLADTNPMPAMGSTLDS